MVATFFGGLMILGAVETGHLEWLILPGLPCLLFGLLMATVIRPRRKVLDPQANRSRSNSVWIIAAVGASILGASIPSGVINPVVLVGAIAALFGFVIGRGIALATMKSPQNK